MRISHGTRIKTIDSTNGYGYATTNIMASLERLGYEVNQNDPTADVEIWFDQPQHWNFSSGPYKIGYHPWESTKLLPGWAEIMNQCDEIWTPSPIIADWYVRYAGIKVPVYVYEHGVDDVWTPHRRQVNGKMKFLHVGMESLRKGGSETMKAFRDAFPNNNDVELSLKAIFPGWNMNSFGRINVINEALTLEKLIKVFHEHHVFTYPSYGEGFGLNPLQAIATGMPTITVPDWAPYRDFLDTRLNITAHLGETPFPTHHPGQMFIPDHDSLVDSLRFSYENYESLANSAQNRVDDIKAYYDWDRVTSIAFESLSERL